MDVTTDGHLLGGQSQHRPAGLVEPEADDEPIDRGVTRQQRGADRAPPSEGGSHRAGGASRYLPAEVDADEVGRGRGDGVAVDRTDLGREEGDDDRVATGSPAVTRAPRRTRAGPRSKVTALVLEEPPTRAASSANQAARVPSPLITPSNQAVRAVTP